MHRLAHDVVDACGEQAERVVERVALVETEHRRARPLANDPRQRFPFATVSDQERLDRMHVRVADFADPFAELCGLDTRGRDALAVKTGCVTSATISRSSIMMYILSLQGPKLVVLSLLTHERLYTLVNYSQIVSWYLQYIYNYYGRNEHFLFNIHSADRLLCLDESVPHAKDEARDPDRRFTKHMFLCIG